MCYCLSKKDLSHFTKLDMTNHLCQGKKYHFHSCWNCLYTFNDKQINYGSQKVWVCKPAFTDRLWSRAQPLAAPACPGPWAPAKHLPVAPSVCGSISQRDSVGRTWLRCTAQPVLPFPPVQQPAGESQDWLRSLCPKSLRRAVLVRSRELHYITEEPLRE